MCMQVREPGFEALSRGAQAVTFVEAHAQIAALITQTAQGLKESGQRGVAVRILRTTAEKFCARVSNTKMFDLVLWILRMPSARKR